MRKRGMGTGPTQEIMNIYELAKLYQAGDTLACCGCDYQPGTRDWSCACDCHETRDRIMGERRAPAF